MKRKIFTEKVVPLVLAGTILTPNALAVVPAYAASTSNEVSDREVKNAKISMKAATEGMVLLQNNNNVLPISNSGKIALFGGGAVGTVKGGTGSGDVNQRYTVSVMQALKNAGYDITSNEWIEDYKEKYDEGYKDYYDKNGGNPLAPAFSFPDYEIDNSDIQNASSADTAIYVISRSSGEGSDRKEKKGDYYLTDEEYSNIKKMAQNFENSIVLLNVGGVIDTKFIKEIPELDSVLLMSQAGMEGGTAAVKVLNGEVNPSGKLTETWAQNYSDYPASKTFSGNDGDSLEEDYKEGIYVGYRYFDTFNVKPAYEFGYGLSYTSFDMKVDSVKVNDGQVTVKVNVKNTGKYSGKEVAQVYFSAPNGKLEKPYQELAAYSKTDLLKPGESQTLTMSYNVSEMSSYDEEEAAYIMEKGNYIVRVGNSSRNTHVGAVLSLDNTVTTEQLSNQIPLDHNMKTLSKNGTKPYSYDGEENEIENAVKISISATDFDLIDGDNASPFDDKETITYVTTGAAVKVSNERSNEEDLDIVDDYESDMSDVTTSAAVKVRKDKKSVKENSKELKAKDNETIVEVDNKKDATLYDVYTGKITMEEFVAGLSSEELANLTEGISTGISWGPVVGAQAAKVEGGAGETTGKYIESKGIPNLVLADGPAGIRITNEYERDGQKYYQYCTAWPIGTLLAQTWNNDIIEEVGKKAGEEMLEYGITIWLAPGMNIQRDPLCGRNFEYYSEDPFLSGMIGSSCTKGVQTNPGIGVSIKHFASNNQEENRSVQNNTVTERTLREIYLKAFEIAVKSSQPMTIMSSYNKLNGNYTAEDYDLLTDIARGEWKFDGLVMSDWYSQADPIKTIQAGNDLIMPGGSQKDLVEGLEDIDPEFADDGYIKTETKIIFNGADVSFDNIELWHDFIPDADGELEFDTKVKEGKKINNKVWDLVDEGKVTVVTTSAGVIVNDDTECERKVIYKGNYKENPLLRGDIQKCAMNVLNIIMQSDQFAEMYKDKGVKAKSYTDKYGDLKDYLITENSEISYNNSNNNSSSSSGSSGSHHHSSNSSSSSDNNLSESNSNENKEEATDKKTVWDKNADGTWSYFDENGLKVTSKWINTNGKWYHLNNAGTMETGWIKDTNGKWYYLNTTGEMKTGWLKDTNGKWYYLNNSGEMNTGWLKDVNGKWYYLNNSGEMETGWLKDVNGKWYYLNNSGGMETGWLKDTDGRWYYLNSDGSMAVGTTINGYKIGSDGVWID